MKQRLPHIALFVLLLLWLAIAAPGLSERYAKLSETRNLLGDRSRVSIDLVCLAAGATHSRPAGVHIVYAAATSCDLVIGGDACAVAAGHALRIDAGESFSVASRSGTAIVASVFPVGLGAAPPRACS